VSVPVFWSSSTTTEGLLVVLGETANVVQGDFELGLFSPGNSKRHYIA